MTLTNSYLTTCAYALALRRASLTSALALLLCMAASKRTAHWPIHNSSISNHGVEFWQWSAWESHYLSKYTFLSIANIKRQIGNAQCSWQSGNHICVRDDSDLTVFESHTTQHLTWSFAPLWPCDVIWRETFHVMAYRMFDSTPLTKLLLTYSQLEHWEIVIDMQ